MLDEDVLPRLTLPRGVPAAISTGAHYVILVAGFLIAIGAAGFDLGKFTLLAGALGVGIGFGLQNVVNNFVSGLILLFERPVQTGDTIEVGPLSGEVMRIGIRSSTIRTSDGADVIVPNASLISERLVNWTFSDRSRRIDLDVGVAYGSDPNKVLALLLETARAHGEVMSLPEPAGVLHEVPGQRARLPAPRLVPRRARRRGSGASSASPSTTRCAGPALKSPSHRRTYTSRWNLRGRTDTRRSGNWSGRLKTYLSAC